MSKWHLFRATIVVLIATTCAHIGRADSVTVAKVADGDTFTTSEGQKIRILGIDAPEDDALSRDHLVAMIAGVTVTLEYEGDRTDKYGRTLAFLRLSDGTDVGRRMVADGYALVYVKYSCSRTDEYLEVEHAARGAGRGIWAGHLKSASQLPVTTSRPPISIDRSKEDLTQTVYVTKSGTKYHRAGCRYLAKSAIPMSLGDAMASHGPCSVCVPPTAGTAAPGSTTQPSLTHPSPSTSSSGRCAATTKKGTRCKRTAKAGSRYCWQHGR